MPMPILHDTLSFVLRRIKIDNFIASKERYPDLMTEEQIITQCIVNVVAGVGTSTVSTINVLKYLSRNMAETQLLSYLDGLVREGIPLRGADGFNPNGRVVGPEGLVLPGKVKLPPGTVVGIKPSVASIRERTFGPRPYELVPDRWCRGDDETEEDYVERRALMERGDML
ncbi:Uu.00g123590.m01.CDS01 [Anthostomella pinea]|uniref:Uu.00g123590.m01.CDS01 n=1 Tax=Anthostomella pinea TaxID=933095 RepID=A0AAI8YHE9_9PEZI|nr:Uu.00g123590.m01.CDS01 [Anthostomella pinea]